MANNRLDYSNFAPHGFFNKVPGVLSYPPGSLGTIWELSKGGMPRILSREMIENPKYWEHFWEIVSGGLEVQDVLDMSTEKRFWLEQMLVACLRPPMDTVLDQEQRDHLYRMLFWLKRVTQQQGLPDQKILEPVDLIQLPSGEEILVVDLFSQELHGIRSAFNRLRAAEGGGLKRQRDRQLVRMSAGHDLDTPFGRFSQEQMRQTIEAQRLSTAALFVSAVGSFGKSLEKLKQALQGVMDGQQSLSVDVGNDARLVSIVQKLGACKKLTLRLQRQWQALSKQQQENNLSIVSFQPAVIFESFNQLIGSLSQQGDEAKDDIVPVLCLLVELLEASRLESNNDLDRVAPKKDWDSEEGGQVYPFFQDITLAYIGKYRVTQNHYHRWFQISAAMVLALGVGMAYMGGSSAYGSLYRVLSELGEGMGNYITALLESTVGSSRDPLTVGRVGLSSADDKWRNKKDYFPDNAPDSPRGPVGLSLGPDLVFGVGHVLLEGSRLQIGGQEQVVPFVDTRTGEEIFLPINVIQETGGVERQEPQIGVFRSCPGIIEVVAPLIDPWEGQTRCIEHSEIGKIETALNRRMPGGLYEVEIGKQPVWLSAFDSNSAYVHHKPLSGSVGSVFLRANFQLAVGRRGGNDTLLERLARQAIDQQVERRDSWERGLELSVLEKDVLPLLEDGDVVAFWGTRPVVYRVNESGGEELWVFDGFGLSLILWPQEYSQYPQRGRMEAEDTGGRLSSFLEESSFDFMNVADMAHWLSQGSYNIVVLENRLGESFFVHRGKISSELLGKIVDDILLVEKNGWSGEGMQRLLEEVVRERPQVIVPGEDGFLTVHRKYGQEDIFRYYSLQGDPWTVDLGEGAQGFVWQSLAQRWAVNLTQGLNFGPMKFLTRSQMDYSDIDAYLQEHFIGPGDRVLVKHQGGFVIVDQEDLSFLGKEVVKELNGSMADRKCVEGCGLVTQEELWDGQLQVLMDSAFGLPDGDLVIFDGRNMVRIFPDKEEGVKQQLLDPLGVDDSVDRESGEGSFDDLADLLDVLGLQEAGRKEWEVSRWVLAEQLEMVLRSSQDGESQVSGLFIGPRQEGEEGWKVWLSESPVSFRGQRKLWGRDLEAFLLGLDDDKWHYIYAPEEGGEQKILMVFSFDEKKTDEWSGVKAFWEGSYLDLSWREAADQLGVHMPLEPTVEDFETVAEMYYRVFGSNVSKPLFLGEPGVFSESLVEELLDVWGVSLDQSLVVGYEQRPIVVFKHGEVPVATGTVTSFMEDLGAKPGLVGREVFLREVVSQLSAHYEGLWISKLPEVETLRPNPDVWSEAIKKSFSGDLLIEVPHGVMRLHLEEDTQIRLTLFDSSGHRSQAIQGEIATFAEGQAIIWPERLLQFELVDRHTFPIKVFQERDQIMIPLQLPEQEPSDDPVVSDRYVVMLFSGSKKALVEGHMFVDPREQTYFLQVRGGDYGHLAGDGEVVDAFVYRIPASQADVWAEYQHIGWGRDPENLVMLERAQGVDSVLLGDLSVLSSGEWLPEGSQEILTGDQEMPEELVEKIVAEFGFDSVYLEVQEDLSNRYPMREWSIRRPWVVLDTLARSLQGRGFFYSQEVPGGNPSPPQGDLMEFLKYQYKDCDGHSLTLFLLWKAYAQHYGEMDDVQISLQFLEFSRFGEADWSEVSDLESDYPAFPMRYSPNHARLVFEFGYEVTGFDSESFLISKNVLGKTVVPFETTRYFPIDEKTQAYLAQQQQEIEIIVSDWMESKEEGRNTMDYFVIALLACLGASSSFLVVNQLLAKAGVLPRYGHSGERGERGSAGESVFRSKEGFLPEWGEDIYREVIEDKILPALLKLKSSQQEKVLAWLDLVFKKNLGRGRDMKTYGLYMQFIEHWTGDPYQAGRDGECAAIIQQLESGRLQGESIETEERVKVLIHWQHFLSLFVDDQHPFVEDALKLALATIEKLLCQPGLQDDQEEVLLTVQYLLSIRQSGYVYERVGADRQQAMQRVEGVLESMGEAWQQGDQEFIRKSLARLASTDALLFSLVSQYLAENMDLEEESDGLQDLSAQAYASYFWSLIGSQRFSLGVRQQLLDSLWVNDRSAYFAVYGLRDKNEETGLVWRMPENSTEVRQREEELVVSKDEGRVEGVEEWLRSYEGRIESLPRQTLWLLSLGQHYYELGPGVYQKKSNGGGLFLSDDVCRRVVKFLRAPWGGGRKMEEAGPSVQELSQALVGVNQYSGKVFYEVRVLVERELEIIKNLQTLQSLPIPAFGGGKWEGEDAWRKLVDVLDGPDIHRVQRLLFVRASFGQVLMPEGQQEICWEGLCQKNQGQIACLLELFDMLQLPRGFLKPVVVLGEEKVAENFRLRRRQIVGWLYERVGGFSWSKGFFDLVKAAKNTFYCSPVGSRVDSYIQEQVELLAETNNSLLDERQQERFFMLLQELLLSQELEKDREQVVGVVIEIVSRYSDKSETGFLSQECEVLLEVLSHALEDFTNISLVVDIEEKFQQERNFYQAWWCLHRELSRHLNRLQSTSHALTQPSRQAFLENLMVLLDKKLEIIQEEDDD